MEVAVEVEVWQAGCGSGGRKGMVVEREAL